MEKEEVGRSRGVNYFFEGLTGFGIFLGFLRIFRLFRDFSLIRDFFRVIYASEEVRSLLDKARRIWESFHSE